MIDFDNTSVEKINKLRNDYKNYGGLVFNDETLYNPLTKIPKELEETPHLYYIWLLSRQEYLNFFCSEFLNVKPLLYQSCIIQELWNRKFPMLIGSRGLGKTWMMAVYIMIRATILQGRKIVVAGASFRQSKLVYEYCCQIWNNAPLLRDSVKHHNGDQGPKGGNDAVHFKIGDSTIIFIPVGSGQTIRGLRANDIIVDEFSSHNKEIFENVIAGFAAVQGSPHEKVAEKLEEDFNNMFGIEMINEKDDLSISNQIIISGTAYYHFNHFSQYWEKWHKIISSRGREDQLRDIFPDGVEEGFNWKDYSIIRIPYDILPSQYMDSGNIARSKATLSSSLFTMEMEAVFSKDSDGFFKATLIESCVASERNEIEKGDGLVNFFPRLSGDNDKRYYMGVDTASQVDNFAIVIIEAHRDHRRIVYCWTTNTKEFKQGRKSGDISETDFFRYCSGKIRDLMTKFNIEIIAIDSQGGGRTIYETLHDKQSLKPGEQMIWETIVPDKPKDTDPEEGLHIIEMVNFRKQEYTITANHGLKKDFEDKVCLFPEYNPAILASYSNLSGKFAQDMEDCIENIEELKRELTLIVVTSTATGNERFDTPENKTPGVTEKSRNKKDRYSALIMANMAARTVYHEENDYSSRSLEQIANNAENKREAAFTGPSWLTNKLNDLY